MVTRIFSSRRAQLVAWLRTRAGMSEPRISDPLIHVGIRKAASTYLQHCLANQRKVRMASMEPLERAIFDLTLSNEPIEPLLRHVRERFEPRWSHPFTAGMRHVISNERFAINPRMMKFVPNNADAPRFYERFWELTIGSLQRLFPDARVVLVTRAPVPWVKSAYSQAVRGAMALHRYPAFVRANDEYLRQNLSYSRMHGLFTEAFGSGRVLFLPQELLRDDPDRFFAMLSDFAGFPLEARDQADTAPAEARNKSPGARELDVLLNTWRIVRLLDKYGPKDDALFYRRYIEEGVQKIERVYKACYRNYVEFRSPRGERLWQEMLERLPSPPRPVDRFDLPADLARTIAGESRFLLGKPGYEAYGEAYAPGLG